MRILSLADIRFPLERANGIQTMSTAHALARRGHAVTLAVRHDSHRPSRDPFDFYGFDRLDTLQLLRAPTAGPPVLRRLEFLAWAAHLAFWRPFDIVFTRDLGVASALLRLSASRRPPVVYESHGYAPVFAETLPDLVSGARPASVTKLGRLERRERAVWLGAEGYVATTRVLVDDLSQRFGSRELVIVAPNGVRLAADRSFPVDPPPAPLVAYAGHLYPWKGVAVFIEALARRPDLYGLVLGGYAGDVDFERTRALADRLEVTSRLTFTGPLPAHEVPAHLARAAVLVLPTTGTPSARYSCPLKMFEYMAAGRPIVASDLPAVREVLVHDESALLVPPEDPDALAAALQRLVETPVLAARLARRAFDDVEAFSWARRADDLAALFGRLDDVRRT